MTGLFLACIYYNAHCSTYLFQKKEMAIKANKNITFITATENVASVGADATTSAPYLGR
jgi:uncharacterized membrane protein SirB2